MAEDQHGDDKGPQNGQDLEPEPFAEDEAGDPTAAFEALRATVENLAADLTREMTTIRKGVEYTLDQMEQRSVPADYSAELGRMNQNQATISERLHGIEQSPTLKYGPEHYARVIERGGEGLVRTAAQQFQNESRDFQRVARELAGQMASARERRTQNQWLGAIGLVGGIVGILATLFLPSLMPFSAAPHVASFVMAKSPWRAGMDLMEFGSPETWYRVLSADQLIEANKAEVSACRETAAKVRKDQRCTITVAAPEK